MWKNNKEIILPLKSELQLLIYEYKSHLSNDKELVKLVPHDENYLSTFISNITFRIVKKRYSPTNLSNTFIRKALLRGNFIFEISQLTLESTNTIEKHIKDPENLLHTQTAILNSF